jgi:hypothetical protein
MRIVQKERLKELEVTNKDRKAERKILHTNLFMIAMYESLLKEIGTFHFLTVLSY